MQRPERGRFIRIFLLLIFSLAFLSALQLRSSRFFLAKYSNTVKDDFTAHGITNETGTGLVTEISIIGERNSGTSWTVSHMRKCFNHTLRVREALVRHKHWFQDNIDTGRRRKGTLVIAQFRNPYDWMEAMRQVPHHAPKHFKLGWNEFATTSWTMDRTKNDTDILKSAVKKFGSDTDVANDLSAIECQEHFTYNQINSCMKRPYPEGYFEKKPPVSGHQPRYEMRDDGSGEPYSSIVNMRADKIKNHLSVAEWEWVVDLFPLQYEELLKSGTSFLIEHIENVTGVKSNCAPYPAQDRRKREIDPKFQKWITKNVDWDTERLIKYEPW